MDSSINKARQILYARLARLTDNLSTEAEIQVERMLCEQRTRNELKQLECKWSISFYHGELVKEMITKALTHAVQVPKVGDGTISEQVMEYAFSRAASYYADENHNVMALLEGKMKKMTFCEKVIRKYNPLFGCFSLEG